MSDDPGTTALIPAADSRVALARSRLAVARTTTRARLHELRVEVAEKTNWETWYRRSPAPFLLGGFLIGLLLARRR